jgi:hypothetical protein
MRLTPQLVDRQTITRVYECGTKWREHEPGNLFYWHTYDL